MIHPATRLVTILLTLTALGVAPPLAAQQPQPLKPGQRVRVTIDSLHPCEIVGSVTSLTADTLVLARSPAAAWASACR